MNGLIPNRAAHPSTPTTQRARTRVAGRMRRVGQALALPVMAMPAAGLLLRLGQDDLLGRFHRLHTLATVLSAAGGSILDYLPLLFAVGLGLGLSQSKQPAAGPVLACVVAWLMLARTTVALNPLPAGQLDTPPSRWPYGSLSGIIAGLLAVAVWRVVERRRIPAFAGYGIIALAAAGTGWALGLVYPGVNRGLTAFGTAVAGHPVIGGALFGFVNRVLLVVGLHQVPNTIVWYLTGTCQNGVSGDIPCFLHGDPGAGIFQGGFFPVSMFGLPAAAFAMWRSVPPERRRSAAQILLPAGAMSALFGVTEPLELSFAFVAAPLYLVHAALTGLSLAIVNALHVHDGFIFSAGSFDYVVNFSLATRPLWLLPIGAVYAAVYYVIFRYAIIRFDLPTPGRRAPVRPARSDPIDRAPGDDLTGQNPTPPTAVPLHPAAEGRSSS